MFSSPSLRNLSYCLRSVYEMKGSESGSVYVVVEELFADFFEVAH